MTTRVCVWLNQERTKSVRVEKKAEDIIEVDSGMYKGASNSRLELIFRHWLSGQSYGLHWQTAGSSNGRSGQIIRYLPSKISPACYKTPYDPFLYSDGGFVFSHLKISDRAT